MLRIVQLQNAPRGMRKCPVPPLSVMLTDRFWGLVQRSSLKGKLLFTCLHTPLTFNSAKLRERWSRTHFSVRFDNATFPHDLGVLRDLRAPQHLGNSGSNPRGNQKPALRRLQVSHGVPSHRDGRPASAFPVLKNSPLLMVPGLHSWGAPL